MAGAQGSLHGFPASLTSFVGRAQATRQIAAQLAEYRLVTLAGPGGAGKTRLAGEVAKQVAGRFADGVWLAELAAVRDPAQVPAAVAAALGIHDLPVVAASDALAQALARRQLLLVLDNCEQVIGAVAEVCGRLLLGADDVRVLATSREPLRIAGEVRYRLGPLTLPDPGKPGNPDDPAGSEAESEAVTLFADRARRAEPSFTLDAPTRKTVDQLVARLDGMPLAIELAAARVDALGVPQLLDRIDDRFALLVDGDRLAQQRQRSLAAAVQWSYELLDAEEQRVFRAVSVLPGPFTLDGAEAVAGPAACQTVPRLVDCSLLVPPRAGPDGRTRYTMLESLRAYGAGLLAEAGEDDQAAAALAGYVAELAEEASAGLHTRTQEAASLRLFDAEETSMHHALAWAMEHDPDLALRLALTQSQWWLLRGRLTSQAPLLAAAAEHADVGSDEWCAARMLLGQAACQLAEPDAGVEHYTTVRDALERTHRRTDPVGLLLMTLCLAGLSAALLQMGRVAEAADDARRSMDVARQTGYPGLEAIALTCLSTVAWRAGDRDGALRLVRQAQDISGDSAGGLHRALSQFVTMIMIETGDLAGAEQACAAGLASSPGSGRPDEPERPALEQGVPGPAGQSHRRRDGASARAAPDRHADRAAAHRPGQPGLLRPPVRGHRAPGRGDHGVGGGVRTQRSVAASVRHQEPGRAGGTPAERPGTARPGRGPGGRGTRRGHEPAHRRRVRPPARSGPAASRATVTAGPGSARAQPPGTRAGHPGRAGPHRRADRGPALHHRAHSQLAPGPDQGQDRLPPPCRPHPAGPQRRPRLTPCG